MTREKDSGVNNLNDIGVSGFVWPEHRVNIVVGAFGSGKTEVSVNWAIALASAGHSVRLADLDIANPYFRSREAQHLLRSEGVVPVIPTGDVQFSDLPVLIPQIKGMLQQQHSDDISIFDVGGDETGARVLASLRSALGDVPYALYQVINSRRPFTDTCDGCLEMKARIEVVSGLNVTRTIINSHLMEFTTDEIVMEGISLGEEIAVKGNVPIGFVTVMEDAVDTTKLRKSVHYPISVMKRTMLPPWLNNDAQQSWPLAAERVGGHRGGQCR